MTIPGVDRFRLRPWPPRPGAARAGEPLAAALAAVALAAACSDPAALLTIEPDLPADATPERVARFAGPADSVAGARLARLLGEIAADREVAPDGTPATETTTRVELPPGHYWLSPSPWTDPRCGNCEDPDRTVDGTVGLVLRGTGVDLVGTGEGPDDVVIHARAGHGIVFDACGGCALRNLTVTDAVRDSVGEATNAAVLIRDGRVHLDGVTIRDNLGDSAVVAKTVSGVIGVAVREGGELLMTDSRVLRNSWDGVAMYRDARGTLRNNVVDGVDAATGARLGGGRGVGIGLTWNSRAVLEGNLVKNYWKGIGVFVDAEAEIRENIVEDVLTWGIVVWDADRGTPRAEIERNAVYRTGACGMNVHDSGETDAAPGHARSNLIVETGRNPRYDSGEPYCEQTAIALPHRPDAFEISGNAAFENREPGDAPGRRDIGAAAFDSLAAPVLERLDAPGARRALAESAFLQRFGRD